MAGGGETGRNFGLDTVDEHAAADGRAGRNGSVEPGDVDHGVADRSASVENEISEIVKFFAVWALAGRCFAVGFADNGHDANFTLLKLLRHFDWNDVATAGGNDERRIFGREREVAEDAFGEAADVLEIHGLALAVGSDDEVVEREGKFDDRIEAGEGTVPRPYFFNHDARMAGAEDVNHAASENGFGEPSGGFADAGLLSGDGIDEMAAVGEIIFERLGHWSYLNLFMIRGL